MSSASERCMRSPESGAILGRHHRAGSWMVSGDRPPFFPCDHKSPLSGQVDISCIAVRKTSQRPQESVQLQKSLFLVYLLTLPLAQLIQEEGLVTYECLPVAVFGVILEQEISSRSYILFTTKTSPMISTTSIKSPVAISIPPSDFALYVL